MTTSCTHSLELSAMLSELKENDEVIMSTFTFSSTANAFALRGAKVCFIDIRPDTMNINESLIENAINSKTKAIVVMHYAGIACDMDKIMKIARGHRLLVIEDAAQAILASYKDKLLGSIGDFGTFSFHETKNIQCGEGGSILINNKEFVERSEIIREKGTNRSKFFRGEIDKYSWVDIGSSYLLSELNCAFLYPQLLSSEKIINKRKEDWNYYNNNLKELTKKGVIELPYIPEYANHNGHIFYLKLENLKRREKFITYLKDKGIWSVFHYIPLHNSIAGKKYGYLKGEDKFATKESERIVRLPLFYNITEQNLDYIIEKILEFFK